MHFNKYQVPAILCLLVLTGCMRTFVYIPVGSELNQTQVEYVVRTALGQVQRVYIENTTYPGLVKAGLQNVAKEHPPTEIRSNESTISTLYNDVEIHRIAWIETPDDWFWAEQTALTLTQIRGAFPEESAPSFTALSDSFLEGVAGALDKYSVYRSQKVRFARGKRFTPGRGTINLSIKRDGKDWLVGRILSTTLASSGQLQVGDQIIAVDGTPIHGLGHPEVFELLSGDLDSLVTLSILRGETLQTLALELPREAPGANAVGAFTKGKTLEITVTNFSRKSSEDLRAVFEGSVATILDEYNGVTLDLRRNGGGLLDAGVEVADLFLEEGSILSTHGRHPESHQYFSASGRDPTRGVPLVVLVDDATASGAELVVAALQDHGRAIVVGTRTFGHGKVQTVSFLPNHGELSLTWAEIWTSAEYKLEGRGVLPTVCTGGDTTVDAVLAILRDGTGIIDRATRTREIDSNDEAALATHRALCPPRTDGEDISLEVAKAILEEPGLYERILKLDQGSQTADLH